MEQTKDQIIYEVTCEVCNTVVDTFQAWIVDHVKTIINLEKGNLFSRGNIMKIDNSILEPQTKGETASFVIQYFATSEKSIPQYIEKYAPELRKDGLEKFGDKLKTSRRVLVEKKSIHTVPQTSNFGYVF